MYRQELVKSLLEATRLVATLGDGHISFHEFISLYGNYYYSEALDGHEANVSQEAVLKEFKDVIRLHELIQTEVLDRVLMSLPSEQDFSDEGRISQDEAMSRLMEIVHAYDMAEMVRDLQERTS